MYMQRVHPGNAPGWEIRTGTYNYWLWAPRPASIAGDGRSVISERTDWLALWEKVDQSNGNSGHADTLEDAFPAAYWPSFKGARQARRELTAAAREAGLLA